MYLAQAQLLYYICSTYHSVTTQSGAFNGPETLIELFSRGKTSFKNAKNGDHSLDLRWGIWLQSEQSKRLAYSAWLLDTMNATHSQAKPIFTLEDANLPLPCDDEIWEAQTSTDWQALLGTKPPSPTLQESLQQLYVSKRLPRDRGEFARILMIHGLYHRLWDVSRYYSNPLSSWEPTGKQEEYNVCDPVWLPSVPAFSKWQNSTCDALDILHWQANATIGQQSGYEHPTVLHLHFARVALLVPCEQLLTMAKYRTGLYGIDQAGAEEATQQIQRWAVQHQFKARLAAIHAGVLFWHVRHHSADAFYEAPMVALAAMTLWAFGTFARRSAGNAVEQHWSVAPQTTADQQGTTATTEIPARDQAIPNSTDDDSVCEIILLDRPTDDELVQQFIRRGHKMKAHITGVGDLYGSEGPTRVLMKGHKLLTTLKCWGIRSEWLDLLDRLYVTLANPVRIPD
ncbi:hypothetical protein SLS60_007234 [Paraconiothyrium brasiliense]|uniref:Xylanolytic transcriptional activator regulatory domain-containing protein n=1 Tax=Paraconiothyrium brasiliense TaxID=300254 RepID=A0ABR3R8V6_9PLEO